MSYKIDISKNKKYFRIKVDGEVSVKLAAEWSIELMKLSQSHGIQRYLFDTRTARNISSMVQNYDFAYRDSDELQLDRSARSAILAAEEDTSHHFVVTTMRNAGFNVQLFTNEASAIAWLEEEEENY